VVDPCFTVNYTFHQRYRYGADGMLTGTVGGIDVGDLFEAPGEPFMAGGSVWSFIVAPHGECAAR
jgi:hypothetical protein